MMSAVLRKASASASALRSSSTASTSGMRSLGLFSSARRKCCEHVVSYNNSYNSYNNSGSCVVGSRRGSGKTARPGQSVVRQSRTDRRHAARAINTAAERDPQAQAQDEEKEDIKVEYLEEYRNNVGLCVVNREGKVFAARRVDDPTGAWQMPQGGIDKGEFARDSALRELEEETGIPSQLVEIVAEAEDWLAYDFPTSVRERIAKRFVKKHHTNGNSSKKFRKKVYKGQRQKWFLLRFTGAEADIDLASRGEEHREFSEWRWIALQNLPQQVVPFKRLVYEQVTDQFCPLIDKHF